MGLNALFGIHRQDILASMSLACQEATLRISVIGPGCRFADPVLWNIRSTHKRPSFYRPNIRFLYLSKTAGLTSWSMSDMIPPAAFLIRFSFASSSSTLD